MEQLIPDKELGYLSQFTNGLPPTVTNTPKWMAEKYLRLGLIKKVKFNNLFAYRPGNKQAQSIWHFKITDKV